MIALLLSIQTSGALPSVTQWSPPKEQSAKCMGTDQSKRPQTLTLVNRWSASDRRMVLYVQQDTSGLLRSGDWLENESLGYDGSDRKYGFYTSWGRFDRFSKHVGDRYVHVVIEETGIASAKVRYLWRSYASRFQDEAGTVVLVGTCTLFVGDELRSFRNLPKREPYPQ